jgi:hypothetical protein
MLHVGKTRNNNNTGFHVYVSAHASGVLKMEGAENGVVEIMRDLTPFYI